jgi:hypothetical protein
MNRRNVLLTISGLLIATALICGYRWFFSTPALTILLRCPANTSGTLLITKVLQNGESSKDEAFNLVEACRKGKIEIGSYLREEEIQITLVKKNGEKNKITLKYGQEIHSDQDGFYVVLKMLQNPPFITKDSI